MISLADLAFTSEIDLFEFIKIFQDIILKLQFLLPKNTTGVHECMVIPWLFIHFFLSKVISLTIRVIEHNLIFLKVILPVILLSKQLTTLRVLTVFRIMCLEELRLVFELSFL